jgi:hypothetical protein
MSVGLRPLFTLAFLLLPVLFFGIPTLQAASPAQTINIPDAGAVDEDDTPEVTDRVARVSFVEGTVKLRRAESTDWEAVTLNLPLVEGDEVATDKGSRIEIQFAKDKHVRLAENSSLKILTLRDDGIALGLTLGTATVRLDNFDKAKAFFEIDAPKTTVAAERSGTYRIDAGEADAQEVRVAATGGGEAHVYTDNAGFTLKDGRSARMGIAGADAGEWQTTNAAAARDEFDTWSDARDLAVAEKLKKAHYNTYYDDDMFGADDLDLYGEWIHTSKYGWVWRPDSSAITSYADWTPYRYGRWEWMPPFGWIWVNDEPWGWATYHHGRWVYDNGAWVWAPYPYYRPKRSWWFPALVVVSVVDTNVCWYPASYHHHYQWDYWGHRGRRDDHDRDHQHGRDHDRSGTNAKNTPPRNGPPWTDGDTKRDHDIHPPRDVPSGAVVGLPAGEFSRGGHGGRPMPRDVADEALGRELKNGELVALGRNIRDRAPDTVRTGPPSWATEIEGRRTEVGAGTRNNGEQLDRELQRTRMYGNRTPKTLERVTSPPILVGTTVTERPAGAVERPRSTGERTATPPTPVGTTTTERPTGAVERDNHHREGVSGPARNAKVDPDNESNGEVQPRPERPSNAPRSEPRSEPRAEPKRGQPRPERSEPRTEPKTEQRSQPPSHPEPRSEPQSLPAPRSEPRAEPKTEPKSSPSKTESVERPAKQKDD